MSKDAAHERLKRWEKDPVAMVVEEFGVTPDAWQVDALRSWADERHPRKRIALQACSGPGKSAVLAWGGMHALATKGGPGRHVNGACVSITGQNLRTGLWKEFAVWRDRSEFFKAAFELTGQRFFARDNPDLRFVEARAIPRSATPETAGETLSGLHAPIIFYLIDESGGMAPVVAKRAEQGLSNCEWGRIAQAGNPTSHQGLLYDSVTSGASLWDVIRITGDPNNKKRSSRIPVEWAREQIKQYGPDDPWVQAYVLGEFPASSLNTLLTPDEVRNAMERRYKDGEYAWAQKRLGIDVARFGLDRTVIMPRQGLRAYRPVIMRGADGPQIAARVAQAKEKWHSEFEFLDATGGWGMSASDQLRASGYQPMDVLYHAPAINPKYKNRRVEMWMEMAKWVKRGGWLPDMPMLVQELTVPTYTFSNGQYMLQEKDLVKKVLGRSPDIADALGLTFAMPDMPAGDSPEGLKRARKYAKAMADYDPFAQEWQNT